MRRFPRLFPDKLGPLELSGNLVSHILNSIASPIHTLLLSMSNGRGTKTESDKSIRSFGLLGRSSCKFCWCLYSCSIYGQTKHVFSYDDRYHRRKFRSQTSDNMDRWKAEQGRGRQKRRVEERRSEKRKSQKKEDADARKGRKVAKHWNTMFFQWFEAPEGRKVGSLKRRVRSQLARWEMKNCTPLWREAHFEVKMYKAHHCRTTFGSWDVEKVHAVVARSTFRSENVYKTPQPRTTFGSWDVEKVHAVVARSTFRSQNVQNTPRPDHFWQLRCRKSARRWTARSAFRSQNAQNTTCSRHFWRFRCRFAWQAQRILHLVKCEQNVRVLQHFQKRWQAWGIWRGSSKMHFAWQVQYKRHVHQSC